MSENGLRVASGAKRKKEANAGNIMWFGVNTVRIIRSNTIFSLLFTRSQNSELETGTGKEHNQTDNTVLKAGTGKNAGLSGPPKRYSSQRVAKSDVSISEKIISSVPVPPLSHAQTASLAHGEVSHHLPAPVHNTGGLPLHYYHTPHGYSNSYIAPTSDYYYYQQAYTNPMQPQYPVHM